MLVCFLFVSTFTSLFPKYIISYSSYLFYSLGLWCLPSTSFFGSHATLCIYFMMGIPIRWLVPSFFCRYDSGTRVRTLRFGFVFSPSFVFAFLVVSQTRFVVVNFLELYSLLDNFLLVTSMFWRDFSKYIFWLVLAFFYSCDLEMRVRTWCFMFVLSTYFICVSLVVFETCFFVVHFWDSLLDTSVLVTCIFYPFLYYCFH